MILPLQRLAGYDPAPAMRLDFHQSMLNDRVRTDAFRRAIMAQVDPGDVVVDIGTGTGVLALFAAKAGASRVYAIEEDEVAELAERVIAANGYEDRVVLIRGASTTVQLPEPGDVLVSETIGNAGLDEGIAIWFDDARQRLLKPDATLIPTTLAVLAAPLELPRDWAETRRWREPMHALDFTPLHDAMLCSLYWDELNPVSVVGQAVEVHRTDFDGPPHDMDAAVTMSTRRDAVVHGIGLWFAAGLGAGVTISNAPPSPVPSWSQGVLLLEHSVPLRAGEAIRVAVRATADGRQWSWQVNGGAWQTTGPASP